MYEAELAHTKRYDPHHTQALLAVRDNIASCLSEIGRHEEAQALLTDIFAETRDSFGLRDVDTLEAAYSLCTAMVGHEDYAGCVQFFRDFNLIDATALEGWTTVSSHHLDGELRVVLHHESGERHECRIPLTVRSSVDPDPWPIDAADELRHTSTGWAFGSIL